MKDPDQFPPNHLLDHEQLQMLKDAGSSDDSDLFKEILELYEEESALKIREVSEYAASGDFDSLGKAAHALAGSSANIGGREVWRLTKNMENYCKEGHGHLAAELVPELEVAYAETITALNAMLNQRDG